MQLFLLVLPIITTTIVLYYVKETNKHEQVVYWSLIDAIVWILAESAFIYMNGPSASSVIIVMLTIMGLALNYSWYKTNELDNNV